MVQAKKGDSVKVHYTGTLSDGSVFDSSDGRDPIGFEIGKSEVIPGFEDGVTGMTVGDKKSVSIPAAEAYGEHDERLIIEMPRNQLPAEVEPEIGQQFQLRQGEQEFVVAICAVGEDNVSFDANHPLAGKDLTFDLELVEIV